jgi:hypothetical protein
MAARAEAYADAALRRAAEAVAGAGEGDRNRSLNREAYGLGRLVGAGALDRAEVIHELTDAATACGLIGAGANRKAGKKKVGPSWSSRQAAERAIGRAVDQGAKTPRELPADDDRQARRRRASKPKPTKKPRPVALELPPPPALEPGPEALAAEVWRIVEPLAPTPEAEAWLTGRGLDVAAAWRQGCRDWRPACDELRAVLRAASPDALASLGFNEADTGKPWWPLRAVIEGNGKAAGLAVPCRVAPDGPPLRWRWRCYGLPWDRGPKELAPYGPALPLIADGDRAALVVCEGTPDFLAAAEVLEGAAVVVGLVAVSAGLPAWLRPLLRDARRVVVASHDAPGGEAAATTIGRELARLVGLADARGRFRRPPVLEGDDLADQHKRGELADVLRAEVGATRQPARLLPAPAWCVYESRPDDEIDAVRAWLHDLAPVRDQGAEHLLLFCWYGWRDEAEYQAGVVPFEGITELRAAAPALPRLVADRLLDALGESD